MENTPTTSLTPTRLSILKDTFKSLGIIGVIALFCFGIYLFAGNPNPKVEGLLTEIIGAIIVGLFGFFILDRFITANERIAREIEREELKKFIASIAGDTTQEVHRLLKGFREIEVNEVFDKARHFISDCSYIRVIGTAKQDYSESIANENIKSYLEETLQRVKKGKPIKYRRITSLELKEKFFKHLVDVFENKPEGEDFDFKVMLLDDFIPAYTYLIVDERFLMLSLNYSDQTHFSRHYYTENEAIVRNFIEHFKSVWRKEEKNNKAIDNSEDLIYYFNYRKRIQEYIDGVKNAIKAFPNYNTYAQEHAVEEIRQTMERFQGLAKKELEVVHTIANGNLLRLFCIYLDNLKKGDIYTTITFYEFWASILERGRREPDFMGKNEKALINGADMKRILIVKHDIDDQNKENEDNYTYSCNIKRIIAKNVKLMTNPSIKGDYDFKIYFTTEHDDLRREYYNFAIISSEREDSNASKTKHLEKILFEPGNTSTIDSTKIWYWTNKKGEKKQPSDALIWDDEDIRQEKLRHYKFEDKERKLREVEDDWKNQKINENQIAFLKRIDADFFDFDKNKERLKRVLGENI
jgi:hypothetical protein